MATESVIYGRMDQRKRETDSISFTFLLPSLLLAFALLSGVAAAVAAEPMTLDQALARGMSANSQIRAYELGVQEAVEEVRGAYGAFLPTLSLSHGHNRLRNDNPAEPDNDYLDQSNNSTTVSLTQPVFSGLAGVSGLKRARLGRQHRELVLGYIELQVQREIRRDFYAVLHARARVELWEKSINRLLRQQEIARAWYEKRLATELRLLEVGVELSHARQQMQTARTALAVARSRMANWLDLDSPEEFEPRGELTMAANGEEFPPLDESLSLARHARPDLRLAALRIGQSEQEARMVIARSLPQVDLEAAWTEFDRSYEDPRFTDDHRRYYNVGIRVTMRPFQGGRNIFAWRQHRVQTRRLAEQARDTEMQLETEVRTAYYRWQDSYSRLQAADATRSQAEAAWRLAERSLELGAGSLREMLDAELRLTRADHEMLDAGLYRQESRADMLYALGRPYLGE